LLLRVNYGSWLLGATEYFNVGHFSVRPDYFELADVAPSDVPCYLLTAVYNATTTLAGSKQLKEFDVQAFRAKFESFLRLCGCAANDSLESDAFKATRTSS
jgi:hypothetical protein